MADFYAQVSEDVDWALAQVAKFDVRFPHRQTCRDKGVAPLETVFQYCLNYLHQERQAVRAEAQPTPLIPEQEVPTLETPVKGRLGRRKKANAKI